MITLSIPPLPPFPVSRSTWSAKESSKKNTSTLDEFTCIYGERYAFLWTSTYNKLHKPVNKTLASIVNVIVENSLGLFLCTNKIAINWNYSWNSSWKWRTSKMWSILKFLSYYFFTRTSVAHINACLKKFSDVMDYRVLVVGNFFFSVYIFLLLFFILKL